MILIEKFKLSKGEKMVYADSVKNITIVGPNARLTFEAVKEAKKVDGKTVFDSEETITLVLPIPALGKIADILENLKKQIEDQQKETEKKSK